MISARKHWFLCFERITGTGSNELIPLSPQKGITGKFHSVVPSLDEDKHIFSSHIVVKELNHNLLPTIQDLLRDWNIHCETIQLETVEMACRQND